MAQFSIEGKGRWMKILSPCTISPIPEKEGAVSTLQIDTNSAEWDTGSMVTVISNRIVSELHLARTGITTISGVDGRAIKANTYLVNLEFPGNLKAGFVEVVEAPLGTQDLLIGMDIISECTFQYSIKEGKSRLLVSRDW